MSAVVLTAVLLASGSPPAEALPVDRADALARDLSATPRGADHAAAVRRFEALERDAVAEWRANPGGPAPATRSLLRVRTAVAYTYLGRFVSTDTLAELRATHERIRSAPPVRASAASLPGPYGVRDRMQRLWAELQLYPAVAGVVAAAHAAPHGAAGPPAEPVAVEVVANEDMTVLDESGPALSQWGVTDGRTTIRLNERLGRTPDVSWALFALVFESFNLQTLAAAEELKSLAKAGAIGRDEFCWAGAMLEETAMIELRRVYLAHLASTSAAAKWPEGPEAMVVRRWVTEGPPSMWVRSGVYPHDHFGGVYDTRRWVGALAGPDPDVWDAWAAAVLWDRLWLLDRHRPRARKSLPKARELLAARFRDTSLAFRSHQALPWEVRWRLALLRSGPDLGRRAGAAWASVGPVVRAVPWSVVWSVP